MKKKTKKPKDELIDSLLEDLKEESQEESNVSSYNVGPDGIHSFPGHAKNLSASSGEEDDQSDRTTLLNQNQDDDRIPQYSAAEFFVSNEDKTTPIQKAMKGMVEPSPGSLKNNPLQSLELSDESEKVFENPAPQLEREDEFQIEEVPEPAPNYQPQPSPSQHHHQPVMPRGKSSAFESQFSRAENLKVAQQRILELERDIEKYRKENEMLSSANEIAKSRIEEMISKTLLLEKQRIELKELNESELRIFKDGLISKDSEIHRLRSKVEELESRLANDLRKVRVRERELENRLELSKVEKTTLLRTKDEAILELKRKTENLQAEIESYQNKIIELGQKIEANQDQFARTVRALRLALTNLEVSEGTATSITLTPIKKAD
jgi:hypothetical protein